MTVLVINRGIRESISILTVVIRPMIKLDVDTREIASARK